MVCNLLRSEGSTHGWHLDDPPNALIIVLEAAAVASSTSSRAGPACATGWDSPPPVRSKIARAEGLVARHGHVSGDANLLRADRCLHRGATLRAPGTRRVALNFAYEATDATVYGYSATALYGPTP